MAAKKETATKVVKAAAKPAAKKTEKAPAKAYVFFNCNENKEHESMNVYHNHDVYLDSQASRKALWAKVQEELGNVHIDECNMDAVKEAIMSGNPADATQYMHCGAIVEMNRH